MPGECIGALNLAIEDYDKATELDARTTQNNRAVAQAYTNRGEILRDKLQPEQALVDFNQAIKLFPADPQAYFERGQARLLVEDFEGAVKDFDFYIISKQNYDPFGQALAYADRSLAKQLLGYEKDANKDVEAMIKLAPDKVPAILSHLEELEGRLNLMRRIRAQKKKAIA